MAFHLDKLAEAGVLEVRYERLGDRRGPGAGRPAKLYRVTEGEMWASVPDRRYDFAGSILAEAVEESAGTGTPISLCVARAARDRGRVVAQDPGGSSIRDLLDRCGYQPTSGDDGELLLGNCPFNRLAESHRDLVCGMNLDFVTGLIEGAGASTTMVALLDQAPGRCCVKAVAPAS